MVACECPVAADHWRACQRKALLRQMATAESTLRLVGAGGLGGAGLENNLHGERALAGVGRGPLGLAIKPSLA